MDNTEQKLSQIMNLLNLIHSENTFFLLMIANSFTDEHQKGEIMKYVEKCNLMKESILSGMYEDEITITH